MQYHVQHSPPLPCFDHINGHNEIPKKQNPRLQHMRYIRPAQSCVVNHPISRWHRECICTQLFAKRTCYQYERHTNGDNHDDEVKGSAPENRISSTVQPNILELLNQTHLVLFMIADFSAKSLHEGTTRILLFWVGSRRLVRWADDMAFWICHSLFLNSQ